MKSNELKASDLRIGNLIQHTGKIQKVEAVFSYKNNAPTIMCDPLEAERNLAEFEPIPLTEEILVRLGFKKSGYDYWGAPVYFELAYCGNGEWVNSINCHEYDNGMRIKYVHQLQNLYFALTGEELTLKEI